MDRKNCFYTKCFQCYKFLQNHWIWRNAYRKWENHFPFMDYSDSNFNFLSIKILFQIFKFDEFIYNFHHFYIFFHIFVLILKLLFCFLKRLKLKFILFYPKRCKKFDFFAQKSSLSLRKKNKKVCFLCTNKQKGLFSFVWKTRKMFFFCVII